MAFSPPPIRARATPGLKSASMQEVEVLKPGQQLGSALGLVFVQLLAQ